MTRIVLRGLATRRLRALLSVIAVVLGVALVTGALTLGSALDQGADEVAAAAYDGTDAVVSAPQRFHSEDLTRHATIRASTLERVRATPGVGVAVGDVLDEAKILDRHGKPTGDGPYFGVGYDATTPGAARLNPFRLVTGRWASGSEQVVVDQGTAAREHLHVGSRVRIAAGGPALPFTVSGIARFGSVKTIGTATTAIFDLRTAQALFDKRGAYDDVLVAAAPGVSATALRRSLASSIGSGRQVQTARAQDRFTIVNGLAGFVSFIRAFLVAFGAVAVLVGALTIGNALTLTVAQRSRELALLRAAGASRGQVLRSVLLEGAIVGAVGSAAGVGVGVGLAHALHALVTSFGLDLPSQSLTLSGTTVAIGVATGMVATLASSLGPALRATRVPPVAALRDSATPALDGAHGRRSTAIGAILALAGMALLVYALVAPGIAVGDRLLTMAPGGLLVLLGVAKLGRHAVVPLASLLGRPSARLGGVAGSLARRNAMRHPARTASTAAALMIGVALVTTVAVLASGLRGAVDGQVRENVRAAHVITGADGWSPVPEGVVRSAAGVPGARATGVVVDEGRAGTSRVHVAGVDPAAFASVWRYRWHEGSAATLARLGGDGAIVRRDFATKRHLHVGSRFAVTAATGAHLDLAVRGIVEGSPIDPLGLGQITVARATYDHAFTVRRPSLVLADGGSGGALARAIAAYPDAKVWSADGFAHEVAHSVDPVLGVVTVLLALAVLISILGIVNTLALGVHERTRELGLLRAVGMSRRQVRRLVRHEGALTALVGAVLGIGVGLAIGGVVTAALASDGLRFSVPVGSIAGYTVVAALAGVLAAALPARRAGRLRVLAALAHD
jgi:putative ABC transport system permease protein